MMLWLAFMCFTPDYLHYISIPSLPQKVNIFAIICRKKETPLPTRLRFPHSAVERVRLQAHLPHELRSGKLPTLPTRVQLTPELLVNVNGLPAFVLAL